MRKSQITLAVAAAFGASVNAQAYTTEVILYSAVSERSGGPLALNIENSTATWSYNTTTGVVTGTGLYQAESQISSNPGSLLFTHDMLDPVLGGGGAAGASSFDCVEGAFGTSVGVSICGNYNFGANYVNESSTSWVGTSAARTLGGDDLAMAPQQNLSLYDGMTTSFWDHSTLVISNAVPGVSGYTMTFFPAPLPVPVPPAVWLFGSALGLLGWTRGKKA
jgi:hypothetical protein